MSGPMRRANPWVLMAEMAIVIVGLFLALLADDRLRGRQAAQAGRITTPLTDGRSRSAADGPNDPRRVEAPVVVLEQLSAGGLVAKFPDGSSSPITASALDPLSTRIARSRHQVVVKIADHNLVLALRKFEDARLTVMIDLTVDNEPTKETPVR